jgi:hypothetical protein
MLFKLHIMYRTARFCMYRQMLPALPESLASGPAGAAVGRGAGGAARAAGRSGAEAPLTAILGIGAPKTAVVKNKGGSTRLLKKGHLPAGGGQDKSVSLFSLLPFSKFADCVIAAD